MRVPFPVRAIPALSLRAWFTPPPISAAAARRADEKLNEMSSSAVHEVTIYEIGRGPLVLAMHGWGGRASQMAPLAGRLSRQGFRVVIPELPGHAGGEPTDIKKVAAAVQSVIDEVGEPYAVVGHSFASMVLRLVFAERAPRVVVLMAPALRVTDALDVFGDMLGLLPWARRGLRRRLRAWDPALWPRVSGLLPDQLPGAELLIVHDPEDDNTPFAASVELATLRPNTTVVAMDGVGHNGILTDDGTLESVAQFLGASVPS